MPADFLRRAYPRDICRVSLLYPLLFFFALVTGPRRSLSLKLSDMRVYEPWIRDRLGNHNSPYPLSSDFLSLHAKVYSVVHDSGKVSLELVLLRRSCPRDICKCHGDSCKSCTAFVSAIERPGTPIASQVQYLDLALSLPRETSLNRFKLFRSRPTAGLHQVWSVCFQD